MVQKLFFSYTNVRPNNVRLQVIFLFETQSRKITQFAARFLTVSYPNCNIAFWDANWQLYHSHVKESRSEYILYLIKVNRDNLPDWFDVCFGVLYLGTIGS